MPFDFQFSGLLPRGTEFDFTFLQARPVGEITMHGSSTVPKGWLLCDGATVSRTIYQDLFAVIGTTYGVGNGTTTFNVPNFQCASSTSMRVPAGAGTGYTLGSTNTTTLSNAATVQGGTVAVNFIIRF
jgi:microcystin-dependent protein